jgi:hypothetical protein
MAILPDEQRLSLTASAADFYQNSVKAGEGAVRGTDF